MYCKRLSSAPTVTAAHAEAAEAANSSAAHAPMAAILFSNLVFLNLVFLNLVSIWPPFPLLSDREATQAITIFTNGQTKFKRDSPT
jgi:hypothetical protein